jgi:hypothetical protein
VLLLLLLLLLLQALCSNMLLALPFICHSHSWPLAAGTIPQKVVLCDCRFSWRNMSCPQVELQICLGFIEI